MASIVVTGGNGFIGRPLVQRLRDCAHDVIALDRSHGDIAERAVWESLPPAAHVFHLAGRSFVPDAWADQAGFITTNVASTTHALEYCRRYSAHLIFVSAYVYGIPVYLPIDEEHPVAPNNPYALSKVLAERVCRFYMDTFGMPVTIIRPFNVFGPGQRREFLLPTILEQVAKGKEIRVQSLAPRRDYIVVDDVVSAMQQTLVNPRGYRVLNIGSGESYSVAEIIEMVQTAAGTRLDVIDEGIDRPNEIPDVRADIARAREQLDWKPSRTFAQGIALTLQAERQRMEA